MPLPLPGRPRLGQAPLLALLLLLLVVGPARPISFQLPGKARKCLREEIHRDTLVTGEYEIGAPPGSSTGPSANLKITDSAGHILYAKEDATKGKFAFTTEDYDMFEACFESKLPVGTGRMPDQLVILDMKHGVEAKNYEEDGVTQLLGIGIGGNKRLRCEVSPASAAEGILGCCSICGL
ncbi:transmembrane emp24 domain-containing protein 10 isoform X3 [Calonectris borealis]|uniref:transmembrane emp24 domain-containing protein 10 isoform X3 n=1 Tax=Calonectris borealis TaxID=1323832 RepID=UPI003F4B97AD